MKHDSFLQALQPAQAAQFVPDAAGDACRVSIVIKALNEEKNIAATLESALRAVAVVGGEVVLADSCSSDATLAIASHYPVRIAQLAHPHERCCGVGPQLGYQYARGEFIYILDGDMQIQEDFLPQALSFMRGHPEVAGVGGHVQEKNLDSLEYQARNDHLLLEQSSGLINRLDGGGLYRRSAIEAVGYFSDRNLHSYEEFDLALRLRVEGWQLWRMPIVAAEHHGHDAPPYQLLMRRWRTGYIFGLGELLRATLGKPRLRLALQEIRELRLYAAVLGWWGLLALLLLGPGALAWRLSAAALVLLAPVALMSWRKRSWQRGMYAVVSWSFCAAGLLRGLWRRPRAARTTIDSQLLQDAPVMPAPPVVVALLHASPGHDAPLVTAEKPADVSALQATHATHGVSSVSAVGSVSVASQAVNESLLPEPGAAKAYSPAPAPASVLPRSSCASPITAEAAASGTSASDAAWQTLLSRLEKS